MRRNDIVFPLAIGVGILFAIILALGIWLSQPIGRTSVETHVKVDEYVGINLDTDRLYFGTVSPGGMGKRELTVKSDKASYGVVKTNGENGAWIMANPQAFYMEGGTNRTIQFIASVPEGMMRGNYTGLATVTLYRPLVGRILGIGKEGE